MSSDKSFGVIIRVDSEAFQVLKGVRDRPEVALVILREIIAKVEKKGNARDRLKNQLLVKDMLSNPCLKAYEVPTPVQPHMISSSSYIPGTAGRQAMTPGSGGLDMMSPDGSCSIALGSRGNGDTIIAHPTEIEIIVAKMYD
ncbi:hypothetical protein HAX54_002067 [Datura stramonium]|uniref:Uncharacterized protein n=1 Tax=Datura stramonium TaxID=4076 RepID=A0ABS8WR08_DATST|nr:hypothetical protein [Datura stramonium]